MPTRAGGKKGRGKSAHTPSAFARALRLVFLMATMAALGFVVVLVLDLSMKVIGSVKLGQVTFAELIDKVESRVFDHDVPEPAKKGTSKKTTATVPPPREQTPPSSASSSSPRAPIAAPAPDVWKRDAVTKPDPEVEQARARLDELLKRL